jgi:hypothetical protein
LDELSLLLLLLALAKAVYSNHHKGRLSETTPTKIARKRLHPTKGVSSNFIQRTPNLRTVG